MDKSHHLSHESREQRDARISARVKANLDAFKCKLAKIVYNDHDGVACRMADDLKEIDRRKVERLVRHHLFAPDPKPQAPVVVVKSGDINRRTGKYGYTDMHRAVEANDIDEVRRLKALGGRMDIRDNANITARQRAYSRGFDDLIRVFEPNFVRKEPVELVDIDLD
jgi:hypothetical protein